MLITENRFVTEKCYLIIIRNQYTSITSYNIMEIVFLI